VSARHRLATLEGHVEHITHLSFHPDGDLLASLAWDGHLILWHAASGRELMRLTSVEPPQFSPDGRWAAIAWRGNCANLVEVTPSHGYHTLVSSAGAGAGVPGVGDISRDGRLLAVGMDDGARLWDLGSRREVARLPTKTPYVCFDDTPAEPPGPPRPPRPQGPTWNLVTSGAAGVQRWSIMTAAADATCLQLGEPRQLASHTSACFAPLRTGGTVAAVQVPGGGNHILELQTGAVRHTLGVHPDGQVQAVSRDGRWAASCGWFADRARLWDVATGEMVHEWVLGKRARVFFTPDSRTVVIASGDEFSFWDVATRRLIRRLPRDMPQYPGWVAFTTDGRRMALEMAPGVIHLMDSASGQTRARLEDPHGDRATWQGFTPDGSKLAVISRYATTAHIWDLHAIRSRLKELNLDWD